MLLCSLLLCSRLHGRLIAPHTTCSLTSKGNSTSRGLGTLPTSRKASSTTSSTSSSCCGSPLGTLSRTSSSGWLPVVPALDHANPPPAVAQQLQQPGQPHAMYASTSPTLPGTTLPPVSYCIHAWLETAVQQHMGNDVPTSHYSVADHEQPVLAPTDRPDTAAGGEQVEVESFNWGSSGSSSSEAWFISACLSPHRMSSLQFADDYAAAAAAAAPTVGVSAPHAAETSLTAQDMHMQCFLSTGAFQPIVDNTTQAEAATPDTHSMWQAHSIAHSRCSAVQCSSRNSSAGHVTDFAALLPRAAVSAAAAAAAAADSGSDLAPQQLLLAGSELDFVQLYCNDRGSDSSSSLATSTGIAAAAASSPLEKPVHVEEDGTAPTAVAMSEQQQQQQEWEGHGSAESNSTAEHCTRAPLVGNLTWQRSTIVNAAATHSAVAGGATSDRAADAVQGPEAAAAATASGSVMSRIGSAESDWSMLSRSSA